MALLTTAKSSHRFSQECIYTYFGTTDSRLLLENLTRVEAFASSLKSSIFWVVQEVLAGIVDVSAQVERAFGGAPQDIEGVWADGAFTVVQSRPQVL